MGSLELYLIARVIRRGVTRGRPSPMGAVLALGYLTKPTMVAFAPAVAGGARPGRSCASGGLLAAAAGADRVRRVLRRVDGLEGDRTRSDRGGSCGRPRRTARRPFCAERLPELLLALLSVPSPPGVVDQYFAGRLPLYTVWMHSFFASFGWERHALSGARLRGSSRASASPSALLLVVAAWRERAALCARSLGIVAAGAVTTVVLLLFVHLAFYLYYSGSRGSRAATCCRSLRCSAQPWRPAASPLGRRWAPVLCTLYVTALGCLATFSYGLAIVRYYT